MYKLSPSLLAADFGNLKEQLQIMEKANVPYLHLDIMDGLFVPNLSIGLTIVESIRKYTNMVFDVHLMIIEPERYVEQFKKAGTDIFVFHIEATTDPQLVIDKVKAHDMKVGMTLKPNTSIEHIIPYLDQLDMVLIMTVEPGFGGQKFMENQLAKVRTLAKIKKEKNLAFDIEVDGGINSDTLPLCFEAGANVIVAGSAVLGRENIKEAVDEFYEISKKYPNI